MVAAADGSLTGQTPGGDTLRVREVWQDNLEQEMKVCGGCSRADRRHAPQPGPGGHRCHRTWVVAMLRTWTQRVARRAAWQRIMLRPAKGRAARWAGRWALGGMQRASRLHRIGGLGLSTAVRALQGDWQPVSGRCSRLLSSCLLLLVWHAPCPELCPLSPAVLQPRPLLLVLVIPAHPPQPAGGAAPAARLLAPLPHPPPGLRRFQVLLAPSLPHGALLQACALPY